MACSVCLQSPAAHNPKIAYIDFDSAYDGPVVKDPMRAESEYGVYLEKIVMCEKCVREGARILGLVNGKDLVENNAALNAHIDQLQEDIKGKDKAIVAQNHTIATLIDSPVKRPAGRPQMTGPESHKGTIKDMRSKEAKKQRVKKATKPKATKAKSSL